MPARHAPASQYGQRSVRSTLRPRMVSVLSKCATEPGSTIGILSPMSISMLTIEARSPLRFECCNRCGRGVRLRPKRHSKPGVRSAMKNQIVAVGFLRRAVALYYGANFGRASPYSRRRPEKASGTIICVATSGASRKFFRSREIYQSAATRSRTISFLADSFSRHSSMELIPLEERIRETGEQR